MEKKVKEVSVIIFNSNYIIRKRACSETGEIRYYIYDTKYNQTDVMKEHYPSFNAAKQYLLDTGLIYENEHYGVGKDAAMWATIILSNDENSTDQELKTHFIKNGFTVEQADLWLLKRNELLKPLPIKQRKY